MEEKISIILPCYNAEKYIEKCINSIINQTYKNIEIIVVNDGSTDNTIDKINEIKRKDDRVRLIDKRNTGVSDSRNIAIEKSTGNYIMFIDADDSYEENAVEDLYKVIKSKNVNIVRGKYKKVNIKREIEEDNVSKYNNYNNKEIIASILNGDIPCYVWLLMINKKILNKYKIKFDKELKIMEDTMFYIKLLENEKIYFEDEIIYNYFQNKNSATRNINNTLKIYKEMLKAEEKIIIELKEKSLWDSELKKIAIRKLIINGINNCTWNLYKSGNKKLLKEYFEYVTTDKNIQALIRSISLKGVRMDKKIVINFIKKRNLQLLLKFYNLKVIVLKVMKRYEETIC